MIPSDVHVLRKDEPGPRLQDDCFDLGGLLAYEVLQERRVFLAIPPIVMMVGDDHFGLKGLGYPVHVPGRHFVRCGEWCGVGPR